MPNFIKRESTAAKENLVAFLGAPYIIVGLTGTLVLLSYIFISHENFLKWFSTEKLSSGIGDYGYLAFHIILFVGVSYFVSNLSLTIDDRILKKNYNLPNWFIRLGLSITILANLVWIGIGISRAGDIATFIQFYIEKPLNFKNSFYANVPGITSFTQLGVISVPLYYFFSKKNKVDNWLVIGVFSFALLRSFLHSERLALIELVVPLVYLVLVTRKNVSWKKIFVIGVSGLGLLILFFIINEARRSYVYTGESEIFKAGAIHFFAYYTTSVNNAVLSMHEFSFHDPFYTTFGMLWKFPLFDNLYETLFGILPGIPKESLPNPQYTVNTIIGTWVVDFGMIGAYVFNIFFAASMGLGYKLSKQSDLWLALYSIWIVGYLEFMRINYFFSTRLFLVYVFFIIAFFIVKPKPSAEVSIDAI